MGAVSCCDNYGDHQLRYGPYNPGAFQQPQTGVFEKAALLPRPPDVAINMQRWTEVAPAMQAFQVQVIDYLKGAPFEAGATCNRLLAVIDFPANFTSDGPFTRELRYKCCQQGIEGADYADLVVMEVWGSANNIVSRAHVLEPMDSLRNFGGREKPLQVQLALKDWPRCVCGLENCPRNAGAASRGAAVFSGIAGGGGSLQSILLKASYSRYNSACYLCKKVYEWREYTFPATQAKRDQFCEECGHITYHNDIA